MPAINLAVKALTKPGDGILINQPVYYPFLNAVIKNGRKLVNSPLVLKNGHYEMDFADLEEKIVKGHVKLALLCTPHNPVGRVWTREELTRYADICLSHGVTIVADEIHEDFTYPATCTPPLAPSAKKRLKMQSSAPLPPKPSTLPACRTPTF